MSGAAGHDAVDYLILKVICTSGPQSAHAWQHVDSRAPLPPRDPLGCVAVLPHVAVGALWSLLCTGDELDGGDCQPRMHRDGQTGATAATGHLLFFCLPPNMRKGQQSISLVRL